MMTKEEKSLIKGKLPSKWVIKIKEKTKFSDATIRKTMNGSISNIAVERAALELAEEYSKELDALKEKKDRLCK